MLISLPFPPSLARIRSCPQPLCICVHTHSLHTARSPGKSPSTPSATLVCSPPRRHDFVPVSFTRAPPLFLILFEFLCSCFLFFANFMNVCACNTDVMECTLSVCVYVHLCVFICGYLCMSVCAFMPVCLCACVHVQYL